MRKVTLAEADTMIDAAIPQIARELHLTPGQVQATVGLLDDGATVPFIARYRKEATDLVENADKLVPSQRKDRYERALQKIAAAARLSGGLTKADKRILVELSGSPLVKEIQKDYFDRVNANLKDERLSRVKSIYPQLAAIDAEADEVLFFNRNKSVGIKTIKRKRD